MQLTGEAGGGVHVPRQVGVRREDPRGRVAQGTVIGTLFNGPAGRSGSIRVSQTFGTANTYEAARQVMIRASVYGAEGPGSIAVVQRATPGSSLHPQFTVVRLDQPLAAPGLIRDIPGDGLIVRNYVLRGSVASASSSANVGFGGGRSPVEARFGGH